MASWTCAFFAGGDAFLGAGFDLLLPPPNKENADFFGSGGETVLGSTFGFDPPNKESDGRAALGFDFTGSGLDSSFAGFDPNKESVARPLGFDFTGAADLVATAALTGFEPNRGDFFGAGAGAGVFFGAGLKNENAGAAFFRGAGDGAGAVVFFGAGLKKENAGAAFFTGAGAGAGAGFFFGAGLKNENAGAGAAFFTGAGDGAGAFFGAGLKKENAGAGAAFFTGAGDGATDFTGAFFLGAGAGAAFFGAAGVGSKNDVKLNVARTASSFLGAGVATFATVFFGFGGSGFGFGGAAFTTGFGFGAAAFTTGFGCGGSGFDFGVSFFSNNAAKLKVGRGGDDLGSGEATFAATTCGGGVVFLATGAFFGAGGLTTAAGFFSDSFFNFEKNPPKSIAGFDGVDFRTAAVLGVERGIVGAFFGLTAPSLSVMSLAWFSSHSLDLARTISAACSWILRTLATSLAS
jgi:hypothetical protein